MSNVSSIQASSAMDERTVKMNRLKLIGIFGVAVIPVVLAFAMYFGGLAIPDSKTNKGNLIWPPISTESLDSASSKAVTEDIQNTQKWALMVTGSGECDQVCKDLLHTVRQVNVSMAKEMERVTRVLVSTLSTSELAGFQEEYPHLKSHQVDGDSIVKFLALAQENGAAQDTAPWTVWIVDPLGNVVLQYTSENDGYDMIADLKRLLKLSNIG